MSKNNFEELIEVAQDYLKTYLDLLAVQFVDKLSLLLSKLFYLGIIIFFLSLTVVFLFISLGLYFGELFHSPSLGFLSLAGISVLLIFYYILKPARGKGIYKLLIRFFAIIANNDEASKS
jgi:hypothetical protein